MASHDRNSLGLTLRLYKFAMRHWALILITYVSTALYGGLHGYFLLLVEPFAGAFKMVKSGAPDVTGSPVDMDVIASVAKTVLLLVAPVAVTGWMSQYFRGVTVYRVVVDIRDAICRSLLPQSVKYFEDRRSGEFISRISNDVTVAQKALTFIFGDLVLQPTKIFVALIVAFRASWQLSLLTFAVTPILVIPLQIFTRRVRRAGRKGLERLADVTDVMAQMFSGIRIVKAFKMEEAEADEFHQVNLQFFRNMRRLVANKAHSRSSVELFMFTLLGITLFAAGALIQGGYWGLTFPKLLMFGGAIAFSFGPLKKLVKCVNNLQEAMAGAERIFEIVDLEPEIVDPPDAVGLEGVKQGIRFDGVTFAYDDEPVLKDVDLTVTSGQTVALVGRSGAGKSTLMDLALRFYVPRQGKVEIDGVDIQRIRRESLLDRIAIVTQQTFLFNRSIADNIRYGRRDATDEEVHAAARAANIHDFIESLPDGYETKAGEFGVKLSGGQRQRIAIARAVLKNADILILDEAMAGLDAESEASVRQALLDLMEDRTTLVITHDLTTIRHADLIVVLLEGEIAQMGTHDELIGQPGEYASLYHHQFGPVPANGDPSESDTRVTPQDES